MESQTAVDVVDRRDDLVVNAGGSVEADEVEHESVRAVDVEGVGTWPPDHRPVVDLVDLLVPHRLQGYLHGLEAVLAPPETLGVVVPDFQDVPVPESQCQQSSLSEDEDVENGPLGSFGPFYCADGVVGEGDEGELCAVGVVKHELVVPEHERSFHFDVEDLLPGSDSVGKDVPQLPDLGLVSAVERGGGVPVLPFDFEDDAVAVGGKDEGCAVVCLSASVSVVVVYENSVDSLTCVEHL